MIISGLLNIICEDIYIPYNDINQLIWQEIIKNMYLVLFQSLN